MSRIKEHYDEEIRAAARDKADVLDADYRYEEYLKTNNRQIMERDVIGNTSADDIRSSLRLLNPKSSEEIRRYTDYLNRSLDYEVKNHNRATVIKMIRAKINQYKKLKPERT
jgi:hypothetical protein